MEYLMRNSIVNTLGLIVTSMGIQMSDGADKSLFGLSEDQFWHEPIKQKPAVAFSTALLFDDKRGIFIDMPQVVHLDQHKSVPLCGFRSDDKEFLYRFQTAQTCKLVVTHISTGNIEVVQVDKTPDIRPNPPSPGWFIESLDLNLLEQLNLGPKLGKYTARILCGPDSSNSRSFELYPKKGSKQLPETKSRLDLAGKAGGPPLPPISVKKFDVGFSAQLHFPGTGPVWEVVAQDSNPAEIRIELKFQVSGLPRFVYPKDKPHMDENGHRVYAALPVHLLAFDENRIAVVSEKLGLPVLAPPSGSSENPILEGRISLGLSGLLNQNRKPKALSIWVISMGHFALTEIKEIK